MNSHELAYAAGLIDGEGCIGVYRNSHNGNYQLRITVEMTCKEPLLLLSRLFGGKFYSRDRRGKRKPTTSWMVFNSEAEDALAYLWPWLLVKHKQATIALEGNWAGAYNTFEGLPKKEQSKRKSIHKRIKKLNARGRQK